MPPEDGSSAPGPIAAGLVERILLGVGVVLLLAYGAARIHAELGRGAGVRQFEAKREEMAAAQGAARASSTLSVSPAVDDSLWSEKRIRAYRDSLAEQFAAPMAVLRIPKLHLEVPVLDGTDDLTLNRAVGRIDGTARPGENGNLGIAGHRDGFFRGLKDIVAGDAISLETLSGTDDYVVEGIRIVPPEDVSVLDATASPVLTLVTCYPFYFVGDAPQRYIVRAVRRGSPTVAQ